MIATCRRSAVSRAPFEALERLGRSGELARALLQADMNNAHDGHGPNTYEGHGCSLDGRTPTIHDDSVRVGPAAMDPRHGCIHIAYGDGALYMKYGAGKTRKYADAAGLPAGPTRGRYYGLGCVYYSAAISIG